MTEITHEMIMSNHEDLLKRGDVINALLSAFSAQPNIEEKLHKLDIHEIQALLKIINLPAEAKIIIDIK